ncbi:Outer membrane protein beta-barrel domain-containing protein [Chitinophaga jiangningensis]|uniref:Outer membrane protein beta-barrel domain-containing protein n=1 Tax=Chitinophaga jiangningensis TaxID=1419482 RepID=A0A1M7AV37_9BACT|nr:outer membrane beta-barrel protein [Chitinophaga jiangningensis]SHL46565.1 Outer membrane protein beta-barrel domain-containing protein [Chitinophaga jiangningensis]
MRNIYKLLIVLMVSSAAGNLMAQDNISTFKPFLEHRIVAGLNFGATAPMGFPNTIRAIDGYWPEFSPALGYELSVRASEKWGAAIGVKMDFKGMGTKDEVQYFHTIITVQDGSSTGTFEGLFTGKNKTIARNAYVTFPISAVFTPSNNWRFSLGGYMAWKFSANFHGNVSDGYIRNGGPTGEKVIVDEATFDFSSEVRNFDVGFQGGAERRVGKKLSVLGNLAWGVRPLFPSDFKGLDFPLYNVFLMLGVSYKI